MKTQIKKSILLKLMCPLCNTSMEISKSTIQCGSCNTNYFDDNSSIPDLRLREKKQYLFETTLGLKAEQNILMKIGILKEAVDPQVDYSQHEVPNHLTRTLLSHFPKAKTAQSLMLDLGCGDMLHKEVCEHAGFIHVGLDYSSQEATINGDAHALPFEDESFEFILTVAVLEHLKYPMIAMREANRVLKPGGKIIGTVAFLEPFHGESYYHHSHLGIINTLTEGDFNIEHISPSSTWSVMFAQASMGLFPKMPKIVSNILVLPLHLLSILWWKIGSIFSDKATEKIRIRNTTGAFTFIAIK